jgi:methionyl aminopeptidase
VAIEPFSTNGAGEVDGKKNSNIYSFVRKRSFFTSREASALQKHIISNFGPLPFAERWCAEATKKPQHALSTLSRAGVVTYYPILREIDEGMVAQAEHTVYITADGCEILTVNK